MVQKTNILYNSKLESSKETKTFLNYTAFCKITPPKISSVMAKQLDENEQFRDPVSEIDKFSYLFVS